MESFCNIMHVFAVTFVKLVIRNVSWAAYQHIRIISEESCDTEDWSKLLKIKVFHDAIEEPFCLNGSIKNL